MGLVDLRIADGIAVVTLNNPPMNLSTLASTQELLQHMYTLRGRSDVRVVILTGTGDRAFCVGSDVKEFPDYMTPGAVIEHKLAAENRAWTAIEDLPMPTIAAINATALGGGAEMTLCCDLRVMDANAKWGVPECKLGVFPGSGGAVRLPRMIGPTLAKELMYTGDPITAERAAAIGLINRIAPPGQALAVAMELAKTIASRAGVALACIKEIANYSLVSGEAEAHKLSLQLSDRVFNSEDIKEGVSAFFGKRPPVFRHR